MSVESVEADGRELVLPARQPFVSAVLRVAASWGFPKPM
ncbi:hypothetical protein RHOER0001_4007 [Rhodococcus erythropolis SK121]|nr:hypothetical protein RHOER0001_4007 [Rhodococcus erythropolis SK121]